MRLTSRVSITGLIGRPDSSLMMSMNVPVSRIPALATTISMPPKAVTPSSKRATWSSHCRTSHWRQTARLDDRSDSEGHRRRTVVVETNEQASGGREQHVGITVSCHFKKGTYPPASAICSAVACTESPFRSPKTSLALRWRREGLGKQAITDGRVEHMSGGEH